MNVTCDLIIDGSSPGCKSSAGRSLRFSLKKKLFFSDLTYIGNFYCGSPYVTGQERKANK